MMQDYGHCKHGDFILEKGCPQCTADRMAEEGNTAASIAEAVRTAGDTAGPVPETEIALATAPGSDVEVMSYYTEALKLLDYAEKRVITRVEDVEIATDDLSIIAKLKKAMEEKRREYLDPLKAKAEAIRETYSTLMDPIFSADKITRDKVLDFAKEQTRIREEQEEVNRLRIEAAQKEAALHGGEITESVGLVEVTEETPKRVSTSLGTSGMVACWKYEVIDFALLPDAYKVADDSQLNAIAKSHHDKKEVPGVRFYNEPIIAVRAR